MLVQVLWVARNRTSGKVGWSRHRRNLQLIAELDCDHVLLEPLAEPDARVEAPFDDVGQHVVDDNRQCDIGIGKLEIA
ncbi:hypothetical protein, partial [Mesorhizobium sp. M2E.F.Ca.ET.209.01.1.1]|uniref:hypothetical protein n=1 Tax=Mesorhizobium sp. M2E.F.Ca.ET.209.01.1.1 TaxID=2500526 RepID=UPI001FEEEC93